MRNWAGNVVFTAPRTVHAESIDEVRALVRAGGRIRALGTAHSFNDLADTDGTQVSVLRIDPDPVLDEAAATVTVGAGTTYGTVATLIAARGWALPNMGSLPHISVGGAIATATHGSGIRNRNLASAVRAITFVGADGELRTVRAGEPDFAGSVVTLGALGVAVRVTLAVVPSYLIRQDVYEGLDWDVLIDDPLAVVGAAYSTSVFTGWAEPTVRQVWLKRRAASTDETVPDELLGARRDPSPTASIISERDNTTPLGVARPWLETLPHFRVDSEPSAGEEIQSEYFVPIEHAGPAIAAVRALADDIAPHLIVSELRSVAADDLWLSTASGRDSLAIHFTWYDRPEVLGVLPGIEAAIADFDPRPHWGKVHTMDPALVGATYPRMESMRELITRVDPEGVFGGPALDRALALPDRDAAGAR